MSKDFNLKTYFLFCIIGGLLFASYGAFFIPREQAIVPCYDAHYSIIANEVCYTQERHLWADIAVSFMTGAIFGAFVNVAYVLYMREKEGYL